MQVIRISGPHGCGKSALYADLVARCQLRPLEREALPRARTVHEGMHQHLLRHSSESRRAMKLEASVEGFPYIQERCIYDWHAYLLAYHEVGLLSATEIQALRAEAASICTDYTPRWVIYIDREADWVKARLHTRNDPRDVLRTPTYERGLTDAAIRCFRLVMALVSRSSCNCNLLHVTITDREQTLALVHDWLIRNGQL